MLNYLQPTFFIDSDHPGVKEYALKYTSDLRAAEDKAIKLFEAVRDDFFYNPYELNLTKEGLKASNLLGRKSGYCIEKAILLAAALRAIGIPSRLFFGNVRNHIATEKLKAILKTDVMVFHGSTEIFLHNKWIKVTPAFNKELCVKLNVTPLVFNGNDDAIFQEFDNGKRHFMEYLEQHGSFEDFPYQLYLSELKKYYGHIISREDMIYKFQ